MKTKLWFNKYLQTFNMVSAGYTRLTTFTIIDQRGSSSSERSNSHFTYAAFHEITSHQSDMNSVSESRKVKPLADLTTRSGSTLSRNEYNVPYVTHDTDTHWNA